MNQVTQFKNGLTVATAELPHMTSVSVGLWVGNGSRHEPARLNGVSHFIEHVLFKGTARRSAREISEAVEGIGGYLNAFTSEEYTCFHARACHDRFEELLDVLMDMLLHARFAPADIAKEREVIKEEKAMYNDEPEHQVQELLNEVLWPGHPLGWPIEGTNQTLNTLGRQELVGYLRDHYVSGNTLVTVAGRISHSQVLRAVRRYAPQLQAGPRQQGTPFTGSQTQARVLLRTKKTEQTQIALGLHTCSRHDPRRHALRILNAILGENMSSRLFQVVREDRGLAYSIYSTPSFYEDTGDFAIYAGLDTDKLPQTLRLITRELHRCTETLPSSAELRRARDYAIGQIELASESTETQMNWLGEQLLGYNRIFPMSELKKKLAAVTATEVRAAARDFFRPERTSLALVSPLKTDRGLAQALHF